MDRLKLSHIDEELVSSEVAALCFLCRDVVNRKRLEGIKDAKGLFLRLEERGLLDNNVFLSQLLHTIRRADLLSLLETDSRRPEETDSRRPEETDAYPILSNFRVMLYQIYEDVTQENLKNMKFLLIDKLGKRQLEACNTALDVFVEMEKTGLLSRTNVHNLHAVLQEMDQQLVQTVQHYMQEETQPHQTGGSSHVSMDHQRVNITPEPTPPPLSISETQPSSGGESVQSDAEPNIESSPLPDQSDYYALTHNPRGVCMVINNEEFPGTQLKRRGGTEVDEKRLRQVFSQLGFTMVVHNNLNADAMRRELKQLGKRCFVNDDALVVCVLSHGDIGCVFGADEHKVSLRELTQPFTSRYAPTLAGKPKLFFIQACQGSDYQRGTSVCSTMPRPEGDRQSHMEEDAGRVHGDTVPWGADFLVGMATVPECKSFRNTSTGSIYIQELCTQLMRSARSSENDDILTVLTRVNREVSKGEYLNYKQMPEPKYTLTKKLVLKCV